MKYITLSAAALASIAFATSPVLAKDYGGEHGKKGKMLERLDTDKDGTVSKSEFLSQAEERFGKMDANSDGKISREEAKSHHESMREKRKDRREERRDKRQGE